MSMLRKNSERIDGKLISGYLGGGYIARDFNFGFIYFCCLNMIISLLQSEKTIKIFNTISYSPSANHVTSK